MYKDEAQKQEHHHGQEGEDGAHAARQKSQSFACQLTAVAALWRRCWRRLLVSVWWVHRLGFSEPHCFSQRGVVGEVVNAIFRYRSSVAHGATDSPPTTLPREQSVEALSAESVRASQQFGSVTVQIEVVVAYFALVVLAGKRVGAGRVRKSRDTSDSCTDRCGHVSGNWTATESSRLGWCPSLHSTLRTISACGMYPDGSKTVNKVSTFVSQYV